MKNDDNWWKYLVSLTVSSVPNSGGLANLRRQWSVRSEPRPTLYPTPRQISLQVTGTGLSSNQFDPEGILTWIFEEFFEFLRHFDMDPDWIIDTIDWYLIWIRVDGENYESSDKMMRRTSYAGEATSRTALPSGTSSTFQFFSIFSNFFQFVLYCAN